MDTQRLLDEHRRTEATERVAQAAAFQEFRRGLGMTPRDRLTWLLDSFAYRPLQSLSELERYRLWQALLLIIADATDGRWSVLLPEREAVDRITPLSDPGKRKRLAKSNQLLLELMRGWGDDFGLNVGRYKVTAEQLVEAQRAVREAAEGVIGAAGGAGEGSGLYHRRLEGWIVARLGPRHIPAPPTPRGRHVLVQGFHAPLPVAAAMATLALIADVPPTILRRCPYRPTPNVSTQCARAFVGVKRQKWCAEHQGAARLRRDAEAAKNYREALKRRRQRRERRPR